jgi:hypothetical protein
MRALNPIPIIPIKLTINKTPGINKHMTRIIIGTALGN